jgi:2'-5' RNA ligase
MVILGEGGRYLAVSPRSETMNPSSLPLILTLKLDQDTSAYFDRLRQQYFPPQRNFLSAHLTFFHALPGDQERDVQQVLRQVCGLTPQLKLTFPSIRFLGRGVAVEVSCVELLQLQNELARHWREGLTRQDQQVFRPHITVQNKVTAERARQLYEQLSGEWQPLEGRGEGLLLWYYQGGPWELVKEFPFEG